MGREFYGISYPEHNLERERLGVWVAHPFHHMDLSLAGGRSETFNSGPLLPRPGGGTSYNYVKRVVCKRPVDRSMKLELEIISWENLIQLD